VQHLVFCERQCALIHIEQIWADNRFTVEGSICTIGCTSRGAQESRGDTRIGAVCRFAPPPRSVRIADIVEFHRVSQAGAVLPGAAGLWRPFPVEYKRGRPKEEHCDEVQLCAQAICLEEMLGISIPDGALFYGATRHRCDVVSVHRCG